MKMSRLIVFAAAGAGAIAILSYFAITMSAKEDYSLEVDAMRDYQ